jgi:hypothetical protein
MAASMAVSLRPALLELGLGIGALPRAALPRVLVCGDADFTYALALESSLRASGVAAALSASAYEKEADLCARYPHAADAIAALSSRGVSVRCGVDARAIATHYGEGTTFDRIVFNLPQSPPAPKVTRPQIARAAVHVA